jgi:ribose/xylose/arabinose/galactoside ABC-type transport system permease subunit
MKETRMSGTSHLKYMLLGGAGLFGVLVLLGLPASSAVFLAIALACPLMMVFMMGGHQGTAHGSNERADRVEHPHADSPPRGSHQHH